MSDLIDRQAAIDAVAPFDDEYRIRDAIEDLPSAEPEHLTDDDFASAQEKRTDKRTETHACDLIDRQTAIDALHMHLMYRMGTDSNKKRLDEWINNLPSAQPKQLEQPWIPCSERLPEYGEAVLTINDDEDYEINHIIDEDNGEWFYEGAIAWMPLPPYKEEKHD